MCKHRYLNKNKELSNTALMLVVFHNSRLLMCCYEKFSSVSFYTTFKVTKNFSMFLMAYASDLHILEVCRKMNNRSLENQTDFLS